MDLSKTNLKNKEEFNKLIWSIMEWYVNLKHPGYKLVDVKEVKGDCKDVHQSAHESTC